MKKLIRGIVDFRKNTRRSYKDTFARLALGQRPDTLYVACSDSRVVANVFASSDPGDLFVVRNVGNMVPRCNERGNAIGDESEGAALEYALLHLPVTDIIVCGHSECGAMDALYKGYKPARAPNLTRWLRHGKASLKRFKRPSELGKELSPQNCLSQHNVLEQIENIKTYPLVRERLKEGKLRIHGWWFEIKEANVYEYEPQTGQFQLIDDDYAEVLLDRADAEIEPVFVAAPARKKKLAKAKTRAKSKRKK